MPLYWPCYRHNNHISVVIEPAASRRGQSRHSANGGSWKTSPTVMIAGNAKSASDAMSLHSTVVRELGLRPWEYGWNRDPYVVGLLTRAAAEA